MLPPVWFLASAMRLCWGAVCGVHTTQIWSQQTKNFLGVDLWVSLMCFCELWWKVSDAWGIIVFVKGRFLFWTLDPSVWILMLRLNLTLLPEAVSWTLAYLKLLFKGGMLTFIYLQGVLLRNTHKVRKVWLLAGHANVSFLSHVAFSDTFCRHL